MQTEEPYWLAEAYSSAISDLDLGPVNRAITGARIVEGVIVLAFDPNAKFVDWGGGYGVFTRLMRDKGYDFYWSDAYCQNLFAKHFVADADQSYEMMTCFEVFEHLVQPMAEIKVMLKMAPNILFTTQLPPSPLTLPGQVRVGFAATSRA
jgi:2-polyprenyl-3-methyl-5-hydroxy-6-metoxy-1,4-benzoquinol methylase